jgi:hypothetical protein
MMMMMMMMMFAYRNYNKDRPRYNKTTRGGFWLTFYVLMFHDQSVNCSERERKRELEGDRRERDSGGNKSIFHDQSVNCSRIILG